MILSPEMPMRHLLSLLVVSAFLLTGCGPKGPTVIPVNGIVTLDGAPVAGASVMFKPIGEGGGNPAMGETDAQGRFRLSTQLEKLRDGALEGEHAVTVRGVRIIGATANPDGTSGDVSQVREEWFVPQKYANPETSGLRQTVAQGMAEVELKLSSK
jgi:hypothetical protein